MTAPTVGGDGRIYDRGYRPYEGRRGGRGPARAALARATVRRALGIRRSWRQKLFPWTLLAIATVPAVINVGVGYLTRDSPLDDFSFITYREYVGVSTALLLFVALAAPDAVCPDRRTRFLHLVLARPLTGIDYALVKVGAIGAIVWAFSFTPHVVLFVGQMLVDSDGALDYFTTNAEVLWQVPVAVTALAVFYAALGVAVTAHTTRRIVAAAVLLTGLLGFSIVSGVLTQGGEDPSAAGLFNLLALPLHVRDLVFLGHVDPDESLAGVSGAGPLALLAYVAVVATAVATAVAAYRRVEP